jgi:hypothetical protein
MKRYLLPFLLCLLLISSASAQTGFQGRPIINNISMPTGYTLNSNEFIVGLGPVGYGISDNVQLSTNILYFIFQVYNANLKVSLIKSRSQALAVGVQWYNFNWDLDDEDDVGFTSLAPYAVFSTRVGSNTFWHVGGTYSYFSAEADIEDVEVTATTWGSRVYTGLEHSVSPRTKFLGELGYDLDFEGMVFAGAVLFGWEKFRLKLGVSYYKPEGSNGFTWPVIGLWWRFKA